MLPTNDDAPPMPLIDVDRPSLVLPQEGGAIPDWQAKSARERNQVRLLRVVLHQSSVATMLLAASTALTNFAVERPDREATVRNRIERYLPPDPVDLSLFLVELAAEPEAGALVAEILDFSMKIRLARAACKNVLSARVGAETMEELAWTMREGCLQGVSLVRAFCAAIVGLDAEEELPRIATFAERYAVESGHGGWPSVREDGSLDTPHWIDGRSRYRLPVRIACEMRVNGTAVPVALKDLTIYGAGVTGIPPVDPGCGVELVLPDGEVIAAEMMWRSKGQCGVKFISPLEKGRFSQLQALSQPAKGTSETVHQPKG